MRANGASEKTIKEVAQKARMEGGSIAVLAGYSNKLPRIQTFLTEMAPIYKAFSFRAWTRPWIIPAGTNIITKDVWLIFDTRPLDNEERIEYAKQLKATWELNCNPGQLPGRWYPNSELMRFVENMLKKYGTSSALTKDQYIDDKIAWEEAWPKKGSS